MKTFSLPDLGEGLKEAEIVAWHVGEGDHVVADQPLVAVETEKAVVEVPSPRAGRVLKLFGKPGERIGVGEPLVEFEEVERADTGTVVGELESAAAAAPPTTAAKLALLKPLIKASPAVRELARVRGIDLSVVRPTGPDGSVSRGDVLAIAEAEIPGGVGEELKGVRRTMALNMTRSHASVVPATVFDGAQIETWWSPGADVTLRLARAIAAAAAAAPALNAWYDGKAMRRRLLREINLGIAVDTDDGLIVPVLHDIAGREPRDQREQIDSLKAAARGRKLRIEDLRGATITLSNFGTLAGRHAVLVVIPPQVAILGAGRIWPRPVPGETATVLQHVLPLSLTFDHRVVTGGEAASFLAALIADLQRPT
jgi:2-oxoisovalerate dehydrogenase E2 component (dihydrolipoyl transacylase)